MGRGESPGKTLGMTLACPSWWWVACPETAELPGVGGAGGRESETEPHLQNQPRSG